MIKFSYKYGSNRLLHMNQTISDHLQCLQFDFQLPLSSCCPVSLHLISDFDGKSVVCALDVSRNQSCDVSSPFDSVFRHLGNVIHLHPNQQRVTLTTQTRPFIDLQTKYLHFKDLTQGAEDTKTQQPTTHLSTGRIQR